MLVAEARPLKLSTDCNSRAGKLEPQQPQHLCKKGAKSRLNLAQRAVRARGTCCYDLLPRHHGYSALRV